MAQVFLILLVSFLRVWELLLPKPQRLAMLLEKEFTWQIWLKKALDIVDAIVSPML